MRSSRSRACGDHAAIADQHDVLQAKAALQFLDLSRQRGGIAGVALEHLDGDRPAVAVAQQAVDDLQPVRTVITAVAVLSQLAAAAFQVGRADVVQHQHAVLEMAPRQGALDALLLAAQPVQGSVDLAFLDGAEVEHAAQAGTRRLGRQRAQRRQLGARRDQPAGDHCQRQIALARGGAAEQARQVELAHHADHRGDVAVRQGALDFEHLLGPGDHAAAGEQHPQSIDHRRRQCAEIGDGALTDPLALAITLAQQHGGSGTTVRHDIDEHDPSRITSLRVDASPLYGHTLPYENRPNADRAWATGDRQCKLRSRSCRAECRRARSLDGLRSMAGPSAIAVRVRRSANAVNVAIPANVTRLHGVAECGRD